MYVFCPNKGALIGGVSGVGVTATLSIMSQLAIAKGRIRYETKPFSVDGCDPPANLTVGGLPTDR